MKVYLAVILQIIHQSGVCDRKYILLYVVQVHQNVIKVPTFLGCQNCINILRQACQA